MIKVWRTLPRNHPAYQSIGVGSKPLFVISVCIGRWAFHANWTRRKRK